MPHFLDIYEASLNKRNETLCGDQVKVRRAEDRTIVVLSDGLGSGVKANILATLTSEILLTMLAADVRLEEVIRTVIGTLPTCRVRNIAYATFTIVQIDHGDLTFKVFNFDNPPVFHFRRGKRVPREIRGVRVLDRTVNVSEGALERGDFLGLISDGVLYAGMGATLNFGWGWDNVARFIEDRYMAGRRSARDLTRDVIRKTSALYSGEVGDDATFVGVSVREKNALMVFTGPPLDRATDAACVERLMSFRGTRIVCGGTTGNIVANHLGTEVETDIASLRPDVPPVGAVDGVDLLTEGILTMSKAAEYLRHSGGNPALIPTDRNGAALLARHLLDADHVLFLVGQQINEFYQNPLLPKTISIRKTLVKEIADLLLSFRKEVTIEYV